MPHTHILLNRRRVLIVSLVMLCAAIVLTILGCYAGWAALT